MKIKIYLSVIAIVMGVFGQIQAQIVVKDSIIAKPDIVISDTIVMSKFDSVNAKIEAAFKIIPVPIVSYSQEAGNVFGLAKFNSFKLNKNDSTSGYSKLSEVFTISTNGNVNASVATTLSFLQDKMLIMGYINYRLTPEYIFGIGNDVSVDNVEEIKITRLKFVNYFLFNVFSDLFVGIGVDLTNTMNVEKSDTSFLVREDFTGKDGGVTTGLGLSVAWDSRDNRYNASSGEYIMATYLPYGNVTGSGFNFSKFTFDARKYFNPWHKHVIAIQAATDYCWGDVPYYELSQLGGEERMRGYYKGALRDYALIDAQLEYRMPVWKSFGVTGWIGTGRVGASYSDLSFDGLWLDYGVGFRIKVDSESDINLRMDFGFGNNGINAFYLNFSEAF